MKFSEIIETSLFTKLINFLIFVTSLCDENRSKITRIFLSPLKSEIKLKIEVFTATKKTKIRDKSQVKL